jgi:hypothetical protein
MSGPLLEKQFNQIIKQLNEQEFDATTSKSKEELHQFTSSSEIEQTSNLIS